MLIRKLDVMDGFVNGELGKVVDFIDSVACGAMVYHMAVHQRRKHPEMTEAEKAEWRAEMIKK